MPGDNISDLKLALDQLEKYAKSQGVHLELFYSSNKHIMIGHIERHGTAPKGLGAKMIDKIKELAVSYLRPVGLDVDVGIVNRRMQDRLIQYYEDQGFEFNHAEFKRDPDLDVYTTSGREKRPMMYWPKANTITPQSN